MVFGIQKIFFVIETMVSAIESIFYDAEKILAASDHSFFAVKSVFAVAEKIVGEAPVTILVTEQWMKWNKQS
jgi:hypothetical protein